jgi:acyl-coenzyme A synthetase/AMP-(fatty) acid ligase
LLLSSRFNGLNFLRGLDGSVAIQDQRTGESVTYGELAERVERRQRELGVLEGSLVFLGFSTDIDTIVSYLALRAARVTLALLDPALDKSRLESLCAAYSPNIIIGLPQIGLGIAAATGPLGEDRILLSTSGSTGSPKFVRLTEDAVQASSQQIVTAAGITQSDRALLSLPLHYSFGVSVLNSHLLAGAGLVIGAQGSMSPDFAAEIAASGVTNLYAVPFSIDVFHRTALFDQPLGQLRSVTVAGGKLAPDVTLSTFEALARQSVDLIIRYGATEATSAISMLAAQELPQFLGSVGTPLSGINLEVLDPDESGVGNLRVCGPNVMLGYAFSRADLGLGSTIGGCVDLGDRARIDPEGRLWITGRSGRFAKVRGLRIGLDELESELAGSVRCAAMESKDQVVLLVEAGDSPVPGAREIERQLNMRPGTIRIQEVAELPRTSSGKLDRQSVAVLVQSQS